MGDPIIEASETGWVAQHRKQYQDDPEAGHMFDTVAAGGPGPLPTLLLTTTSRKSGKQSVMPLLYGEVDGGYAIIASKGGDPKHPGWDHNILAQGEVTVQVSRDIFQANTRVVAGGRTSSDMGSNGCDVPAVRRVSGQRRRSGNPGDRARIDPISVG